jgi:hypothetical protein
MRNPDQEERVVWRVKEQEGDKEGDQENQKVVKGGEGPE